MHHQRFQHGERSLEAAGDLAVLVGKGLAPLDARDQRVQVRWAREHRLAAGAALRTARS